MQQMITITYCICLLIVFKSTYRKNLQKCYVITSNCVRNDLKLIEWNYVLKICIADSYICRQVRGFFNFLFQLLSCGLKIKMTQTYRCTYVYIIMFQYKMYNHQRIFIDWSKNDVDRIFYLTKCIICNIKAIFKICFSNTDIFSIYRFFVIITVACEKLKT